MGTHIVRTPTSRLLFGHSRTDITPPVGIYHRMWGAARHDRATGVHRPIFGDVLAFAPLDGSQAPFLRVQVDLVGLIEEQQEDLIAAIAEASGAPRERIVISHSHSHSSGWYVPDRKALPGGELITGYLQDLSAHLAEAGRQAISQLAPAVITYGVGQCAMAANRDYYDPHYGGYVCGYNPDAPADNTLSVARVTDLAGKLLATIVHYACHGTTLAWENTLISPDFPGALREVMEGATNAPCVYLQGACGELGPRDGFVGDLEVADRNGRQLAYAALSTLTALPKPETDFAYQGPVISGATLGTWTYVPFDTERRREAERFEGSLFLADLPRKQRPDPAAKQAEMARWEQEQREADVRGDVIGARNAGARAERARRWIANLVNLPEGASTYRLHCSICRMGDAVWLTSGGEPYSLIQTELRRRFPHLSVLFSPLSGDLAAGYLLREDRYGLGLYQEEPSILAPGCLEQLIEIMAEHVPA